MRLGPISMFAAVGVAAMVSMGVGTHTGSSTQRNFVMAPVSGSLNWSGYIDAAKTKRYTEATGTWTVPSVSGSEGASNAQWIGLGGVSSQDLLQMGTLETVHNGQQVSQLFWEKLPQSAIPIVGVKPGDKVAVTIRQVSGQDWQLSAAITSGNQTTTKRVNVQLNPSYVAAIGQTAEWITEDPEDGNGHILPLASAGGVGFDNATVNGKPITQSNATMQETVLVTSSGQAVVPSKISSGGTSFSTNSSSSIPANLQQGSNPNGIPSQEFPSTAIPNGLTSGDAKSLQQLQQEMQQLWQQWAEASGASSNSSSSWPQTTISQSVTSDRAHHGHRHEWSGSGNGWQWTVEVFGN